MNLHACANCWYNSLQYDSIGLRVGYCSIHRVILRRADHSTCGQQIRKDLLYPSALRAAKRQCEVFPSYEVVKINGELLNGESDVYISKDTSLFTDAVGTTVAEWHLYKRIVSLSQFRRIPGGRGELALVSLGRAYVHNCMSQDRKWTSGIHLLAWIKERFVSEPEPDLRWDRDIRYELSITPERQLELAKWSLLMLRLIFLSDMGHHATASPQRDDGSEVIRETSHKVQDLASIADAAVEETGTDLRLLLTWVSDVGLRRLDAALPRKLYEAVATEVHKE